MSAATAGKFEALLDRQPGSDRALRVDGSVTVPTAGWTGKLTEAVPQGVNPAILILDAELTAPSGPAAQVISELPLSFRKPDSPHYESVTIRGLGADITIPVAVVH